jgi:hypothetical protein
VTKGAGKGAEVQAGGAPEPTGAEAEAIRFVQEMAAQPLGSETEETNDTGGGATDDVPEDFELREDTIQDLPPALRAKAQSILDREKTFNAQMARVEDTPPGDDESVDVPDFDYDNVVDSLPEGFEGKDDLKGIFMAMGKHFNDRVRALERDKRELAQQVTMNRAAQDLQDFRASHDDWKKYEPAMLKHAEDAPELLDTRKGLEKLYQLAESDQLRKDLAQARQHRNAATRSGAAPRFESKGTKAREVVPGQAETLEEAMKLAARQLHADGLL